MKITILNGSSTPGSLDEFLRDLETRLKAERHQVRRLDLRTIALRPCVGCWGCWTKTPGQCTSQDGSLEMDRAVINADLVLWAAPLVMGFPDALLKTALDKHIPLVHPYTTVVHGEAHHRRRYARSPRFALLLEEEPGSDHEDLEIVRDIFTRTALNLRGRLLFTLTTRLGVEELARRITAHPARLLALPAAPQPIPGAQVPPPAQLTLFNGSPRGRRGNTPLLLEAFAKGFGRQAALHHTIQLRKMDAFVQAFAQADCAWIGFPLYTDAMPGTVKQFFEALGSLAGQSRQVPLGFLVQSGFPEGLHSRYIERYLQKLASRLGNPYLGTIVIGNCEGVRLRSPEQNASLFNELHAQGMSLAEHGCLEPAGLARLAAPEHYPALLGPLFKLLLLLPSTQSYFLEMLRKNGALERGFDRPFLDPPGR